MLGSYMWSEVYLNVVDNFSCKIVIFVTRMLLKIVARNFKSRQTTAMSMLQQFWKVNKMLQRQNVEII